MEQCIQDAVARETNASVGEVSAVVTVEEKHESELQEKTVPCTELHRDDSRKLSPKEDGELSSSRSVFKYR